jgi:hypothetical protein
VQAAHSDQHVIPTHVDDNAAFLLRAEHLRGVPRGEHRPPKIDSEQEVQLFDIRKRRAWTGQDVRTRVVHPHIEAAQHVASCRAESAHGLIVGHAELNCGGAPSEASNLTLHFEGTILVGSIGDGDVGPGARGGESDRTTDPTGPTRDEDRAARQRRVHRIRHRCHASRPSAFPIGPPLLCFPPARTQAQAFLVFRVFTCVIPHEIIQYLVRGSVWVAFLLIVTP